jgi:primosomal protein N' (replication factor Y) (superfamily II helicase)
MPELFADVAVRASLFHNPAAIYTYHVPPSLQSIISEGALVWVPFGRQRVQAIVLSLSSGLPPQLQPDPDQPATHQEGDPTLLQIRPISDLSDPEVVIPAHLLRLARWLHGYYRARLWDALELLLPPGVAQESLLTWRATSQGMDADLGALPPAERGVLYFLRRNGETTEESLHESLRRRK